MSYAPPGTEWVFDHAASGKRMRLFGRRGELGGAYEDGNWAVFDPPHRTRATGREDTQDLAMQVVVETAMRYGLCG